MEKTMDEFLIIEAEGAVNPRVMGLAYSGGKMSLPGWRHPVAVELSGIEIPDQIPLLTNHENRTGSRVGVVVARVENGTLTIEGEILSTSGVARGIVEQAKAGADWQLSIGALPNEVEFVAKGKMAVVNGRSMEGPFYHVKTCVLREVSVVAVGADADSRLKIAASFNLHGGLPMDEFVKWVKAEFGLDVESLEEEQRKKFEAKWEAVKRDGDGDPGADNKDKNIAASAGMKPANVIDASEQINVIRAEHARVNAIQAVCSEDKDICARAISEGWTPEKAELAYLKAQSTRQKQDSGIGSPAVIAANREHGPKVLEAAAALATGLQKPEESFDEKILEAAHKQFRHGVGLQEILLECAWANGCTARSFRADPKAVLQAAFSTNDIDGILSNTANKHLVAAFMAVENTWSRITARRSAVDFKAMTGYRLTGDMQYEQVGNGGELKHATLGEASYSNQVKTYGKIFSLTRQDLINDDLGALSDISRRLGRGAALKINDVFWTAFLDNSTFFTAARANYAAGNGTALASSSLGTAVQMFRDQTDDDGKPIGVMPKFLLVPSALEVTAAELYQSTTVNTGGSSTKDKQPNKNVFAGRYEPIASAYLGNSAYTGYSAAAWYLLADPMDVPVIETAFLNGKEQPTVESADADFNTLGIQFRGYHDFGVTKQEYRGGVKMLGEAE